MPSLGRDRARTYRLGIMGGTFDPIHRGHLAVAEAALDGLGLDVVVLMPAGSPVFKQEQLVSPGEDRYAMVRLAVAGHPRLRASRLEVDREGPTYAVDTLRQLRALYPANVELYFVAGADALAEVPCWHDAASIAGLAHLVGVARPGYDLRQVQERLAASGLPLRIAYLEVPMPDISSTLLRACARAGQDLHRLAPGSVADYIRQRGLYGCSPQPGCDGARPAVPPSGTRGQTQATSDPSGKGAT